MLPSYSYSLIFTCVDKKWLAAHDIDRIFNAIILIHLIMNRVIVGGTSSHLEWAVFFLDAESLRNNEVVIEIIVKLIIVH